MAVEGDPSGDGRMIEHGALVWDGILPMALIFDIMEGDHTAPVVGAIETAERRDDGVIWGTGYVEDSEVPEVQAWVIRSRELLEQGAVGVSLGMDSEVIELRIRRELLDAQEEETQAELDDTGERYVVAKFARDDALNVITSARLRHLAIVDTAAIVTAAGHRFGIDTPLPVAATGAIAASALAGDWSGREWMFQDPKFGDPASDPRLRYDPDRMMWSCPPTLLDDGHYFGHITPMGICLRGRPDRCVTPPDGDLEGFMRGRAPAAGGLRTGVVTVVDRGQHGHCQTGVGVLAATQFYDGGWGAADVRVGKDRYGIWFSGMARPGITQDQAYQLCAADVSGHWEYPLLGAKNRATLVGLPAVDVGGFPKGYLTYQEFSGGLAASAGIAVEEGCGAWDTIAGEHGEIPLSVVLERLDQISLAVGEMYAAHLRTQE
jgi:hypothetical protein